MVFSLVTLAIPLGAMFAPAPAPDLPHLARMPSVTATVLHGPADLSSPPVGVVDITAWPCSEPCIDRTAAMAALAHGEAPPPLVTILTSPPDEHPALDAAREVNGWTVLQVEDANALHAAWFHARQDQSFPSGGLLVVDHSGSIRGVIPANRAGVEVARTLWERLQSNPPG